jgi:hypothetical protein
MEEPINPTVKVERPAEAEVILPSGDDDDDAEDRADQPQAAPPKPEQPVEDVQLKKAVEIVKQATARSQGAARRTAANLKPPTSEASYFEREIAA